jgi:surface protein
MIVIGLSKDLSKSIIYVNKKLKNHILLYFFILYSIIYFSKEENSNSILLTIKGTENQQIFSRLFNLTPDNIDSIYVNNAPQENIGKTVYNLVEPINNISIIWNTKITDCSEMFSDLSNITYIDLSHFDTSLVTSMYYMFNGCYNLTSINLNNVNTSSVNNMGSMFFNCISLTSLNLNYFNTSSVTQMFYMFYYCKSLITLDLSNFDTSSVTDMWSMFLGCSSLISLNINNFNTSLVNDMGYMFSECGSLISLNLNSFDTSLVNENMNMFNGCNPKLTICINGIKANNIISLLSDFKQECNDLCFINVDHKLIREDYKCIEYCNNDTKYKYEYNNICYETCPNGTHISSINEYLCEDDIENNQNKIESDISDIIINEVNDSISHSIAFSNINTEILTYKSDIDNILTHNIETDDSINDNTITNDINTESNYNNLDTDNTKISNDIYSEGNTVF